MGREGCGAWGGRGVGQLLKVVIAFAEGRPQEPA